MFSWTVAGRKAEEMRAYLRQGTSMQYAMRKSGGKAVLAECMKLVKHWRGSKTVEEMDVPNVTFYPYSRNGDLARKMRAACKTKALKELKRWFHDDEVEAERLMLETAEGWQKHGV